MLSSLRVNPLQASNSYTNTAVIGERFPKDDKGVYNQLYGKILRHYEHLIADIYQTAGCPIVFPIGTDLIEKYLTGFKLQYIPFDNIACGMRDVEGFWAPDDYEDGVVNIYYNKNSNPNRQHFTKIHETLHLCQFLDPDFRALIDDVVLDKVLPEEMVKKLIERITEKTTAMYLMPEEQTIRKYQENKNVFQLAQDFRVSVQTAMYRLKECGIIISN